MVRPEKKRWTLCSISSKQQVGASVFEYMFVNDCDCLATIWLQFCLVYWTCCISLHCKLLLHNSHRTSTVLVWNVICVPNFYGIYISSLISGINSNITIVSPFTSDSKYKSIACKMRFHSGFSFWFVPQKREKLTGFQALSNTVNKRCRRESIFKAPLTQWNWTEHADLRITVIQQLSFFLIHQLLRQKEDLKRGQRKHQLNVFTKEYSKIEKS